MDTQIQFIRRESTNPTTTNDESDAVPAVFDELHATSTRTTSQLPEDVSNSAQTSLIHAEGVFLGPGDQQFNTSARYNSRPRSGSARTLSVSRYCQFGSFVLYSKLTRSSSRVRKWLDQLTQQAKNGFKASYSRLAQTFKPGFTSGAHQASSPISDHTAVQYPTQRPDPDVAQSPDINQTASTSRPPEFSIQEREATNPRRLARRQHGTIPGFRNRLVRSRSLPSKKTDKILSGSRSRKSSNTSDRQGLFRGQRSKSPPIGVREERSRVSQWVKESPRTLGEASGPRKMERDAALRGITTCFDREGSVLPPAGVRQSSPQADPEQPRPRAHTLPQDPTSPPIRISTPSAFGRFDDAEMSVPSSIPSVLVLSDSESMPE